MENCVDLQHAGASAGFLTTFMPIEEVGDRIGCASREYRKGHGRRGLPLERAAVAV